MFKYLILLSLITAPAVANSPQEIDRRIFDSMMAAGAANGARQMLACLYIQNPQGPYTKGQVKIASNR
jgi:hypothetical protein